MALDIVNEEIGKVIDNGRSVFLIAFNKDHSKILMLKRNALKRKMGKVSWGNIGGKIDPGESSLKAIIREALEETNLSLKEENLTLLHIKETPNAKENWHPVHFFYGTSIEENQEISLDSESEEYFWFDIDKLPEDMFDSKEFISFLESIFKGESINSYVN